MKMNCMPKQEWRIECTQVKDLRMNWICEGKRLDSTWNRVWRIDCKNEEE